MKFVMVQGIMINLETVESIDLDPMINKEKEMAVINFKSGNQMTLEITNDEKDMLKKTE